MSHSCRATDSTITQTKPANSTTSVGNALMAVASNDKTLFDQQQQRHIPPPINILSHPDLVCLGRSPWPCSELSESVSVMHVMSSLAKPIHDAFGKFHAEFIFPYTAAIRKSYIQ